MSYVKVALAVCCGIFVHDLIKKTGFVFSEAVAKSMRQFAKEEAQHRGRPMGAFDFADYSGEEESIYSGKRCARTIGFGENR